MNERVSEVVGMMVRRGICGVSRLQLIRSGTKSSSRVNWSRMLRCLWTNVSSCWFGQSGTSMRCFVLPKVMPVSVDGLYVQSLFITGG